MSDAERLAVFVALAVAGTWFALWVVRWVALARVGTRADDLHRDGSGDRFDGELLDGLPPVARRYLAHAFAEGARVPGSVRLSMRGGLRLRPGGAWLAMRGEQVAAPPWGMVWRARVGRLLLHFVGYDWATREGAEMRWWLWGVLPVVRAHGEEVRKSAAGRIAGEVVWLPARMLPANGAEWRQLDDGRAVVTLRVFDEIVPVTLTVDGDGRVRRVELPRWDTRGRAGPRWSTFVVEVAEEASWGGITIPSKGKAGWRLGEPDGFEFFRFEITDARFR